MPEITVLSGGVGAERECRGLARLGSRIEGQLRRLSRGLGANRPAPRSERFGDHRLSAIHGTFGEDGTLQRLLENAESCTRKRRRFQPPLHEQTLAKQQVERAGVRVSGLAFSAPPDLSAFEITDALGNELVLKPIDQGSSVDLRMVSGQEELRRALSAIESGEWLVERRVFGRELTVGVLRGKALGIVEVIPKGGVYDYERKYQSGQTEYRSPAVLPWEVEEEVKNFAGLAYEACGCGTSPAWTSSSARWSRPFLEVVPLPA